MWKSYGMKKINDTHQYHPVVALVDELIRVNSRVRSVFEGTTENSGLSSMQLTVLTAVVESRTPPTVPQIGRSLGHPRQVIQRAANALLEQGLIATTGNPEHKRAPLLVATASGRKLKLKADKQAQISADALLEVIEPDACATLTRDLRNLRLQIETHIRTRVGKTGNSTPDQ